MANLLSTTVNGQLNTGNVIDLGYTVNGSISTTAFRGINFHSFVDFNYYIGKPSGSWTQPLHIHFYTGIWLRSHHSYGGTRFYNIATGSQLMSVGDGGDIVNIYSGLTVNGSLINTGASYLGIIYDYDDNGYYLNPSSESKLKKLWINNGGASGVGWSTGLNMGDGSNYWNLIQDAGTARQRNYGTGGYDWYNNTGNTQLMILSNAGNLSVAGTITSQGNSVITSGNIGSQSVNYAASAGNSSTTTHYSSRTDGAWYNAVWASGNPSHLYSADSVRIRSSDGALRANIYYDNQDDGYYLDPNGVSKLYSVQPLNLSGATLNVRSTDVGVNGSGNYEQATFIDNTIVTAHVSTGNGNSGACYNWYTTEWININPEKDYEFTVWVKSDGNDNVYFGWHELNSSGNQITSNPYFHGGKRNTGSTWIKLTARLKGWRTPANNADTQGVDRFANNSSYLNDIIGTSDGVMHSATTAIHMRFGTCYGSVNGSKTYFYAPRIREITYDEIQNNFTIPYYNGSSWGGKLRFGYNDWGYYGIGMYGAAGEFRMSSDSGDLNLRVDGWIMGHNYIQSHSAMYSPIYYDGNDSAYYLDPASGSRLSTMQIDRIGVGQGVDSGYRIITSGDIYLNAIGNGWAEGVWKQRRGGSTFYDVIDAGNIGSQSVAYADRARGFGGYPHAGYGMMAFYNWGGSNGGTSAPNDGSYTVGISVGSHPSDQAYGFQIGRNMWNDGLWTRGYDSGWREWVRLIDSTNIGSQSVNYASSAGNADTVDGWHRDDLRAWGNLTGVPSTFTPSSHTHDDRYYTEGESDGRFTRNLGTQVNVGSLNDLNGHFTVNLDGYGPISSGGGPDDSYNASLWNIGNSSRGHQLYMPYDRNQVYWRRGAGGWSEWYRLLNASADPIPASMNQYVNTNSDPTFNSLYLANGNLRIYQGSGTALHIQTAYGYGVLGPQNDSWFHFETDRPNFYFGKSVHFNGPIYRYGGARFVEETGTWGISITGNASYASTSGDASSVNGYTFNQSLKTGDQPTFDQLYNNGWFRNNSINTGLYQQAGGGNHFYAEDSNIWTIAANGNYPQLRLRSGGHQGTIRGYVYADASNQVGFLSEDGNWVLRTWNRGVEAYGSMRAPIFYDSEDTGYYLDPNSTGTSFRGRGEILLGPNTSGQYTRLGGNGGGVDHATLSSSNGNLHIDCKDGYGLYLNYYSRNTIYLGTGGTITDNGTYYSGTAAAANTAYRASRANGNFYIDDNYGNGIVGVYSSYRYQGVFAMGDSYKLPADGTSTGSLYGLAWSHPNAGGVAGNLSSHGLLVMENGTFLAAISGSIRARDDMRAPIFYDSQDTGYYLDPNGASYLNRLTLAGSTHFYPNNWIEFPGNYGLYSGTNNAHFYPNDASYGSWRIIGTRNGWNGINFDANNGYVALMINPSSNTIGFHNQAYGWQFYWESGTLYCHKNAYGGGTGATVLDSSNVNSYAVGLSGDQHIYNAKWFHSDLGNTLGNLSGPSLQAVSYSGYSAFMSFHRWGYYAVNMGLDNDNVFRIGGWSAAANRMQLDMSGNVTFAGDVTAFSDARIKENVKTIEGALDKTLKLRGVSYNRIDSDDKSTKIGVIAQEILEVVPEVVSQDSDGMYNVSYGNITALLIEAIKEQQKQIEELKSIINGLTT